MIRKTLVTGYKPKQIIWLVRLNVCLLRDVRVFEVSCGLLGYGFLIQFYYGEDRMAKGATWDYIREHDVRRIVAELAPDIARAEIKQYMKSEQD